MSEIEIDQLIDSTRVDGSGAEIAPPALAPLASWSEVDPDYAEFATDDSDPDEDEDADDLTQEELDAPEPDGDAIQVIEPVGIELWGQNVDEASEWVKVAEQDLDGDGEAGIAMIPNVPTATSMRYRLRLVYSDGSFSKWSEQQEVTTPRDTTPPPVPSAPWVHTQYGHTQGGWDGELAADSPIDFDHTRLYVQQMEPEAGEEPPEGGYVAGDPQLVTRFSSEGYHMLGFLPEAEHRAFLTSVDTSGNESPRSEYVYFTPEPPVDREEIEADLKAARQERQEYRDAFDERTAEYDRLMAEQEDALAETDAWGHTAVYRADQAAAEAIAARDIAERAEDNAAAARETADGSLELQAITEPEGVGSADGQRWVQYDHMGRDRKIMGVWLWNDENKTWDAVSHDVTYLPVADITQATIGDLVSQRLFAETGEVGDLAVDQIAGNEGRINKLFTDTTVATSVWANIVHTHMLEAAQGFIGGTLLEDGAVTAEKVTVTEEMVAEFAKILHLVADQVDMNTFVAQSGMVGVLEASGIVLRNEGAGRRFSVSGQGWRLEDSDTSETIAQLGLHGDDLLSLHDPETGDPAVNITGAGGLSAVHVSSQGDLHTGGKALAGRHYDSPRWHSSDSVIDYLPQGAHLWWRRVFEGETTTTGGAQAGITVAHLEARVVPGRLYRIKCHDFEMGDRTAYWAQAYLTTSDDPDVRPTRPTRENPSDSLWGPRVPGRVPPSGTGNNTSLSYEWLVTFPQAQRMRVIFTVGNSASTGNVFGTAVRSQALLSIEDLGPSTGPKGYDMLSGANATAETIPELPEDISQSYGIQRTATYTLNLDTRIATRAYYDGTPRFGRWSDGAWYMSLVEFDSWESQPGQRTRMDYSVSVSSWLNDGRGHIFQSSVPTFSGLPASFHIDNDLLHMDDQRNVGRWTPRTVAPEEEALEVALSKTQAIIAVGRTGWGSLDEGLPASGRINLDAGSTTVRLSTEMGGGTEDD